MPERWTGGLLAIALVQLLLGGILAVTMDDSPVLIEGEGGLPPSTVPFSPENTNPATPVPPPMDPASPDDPAGPTDPSPATGVPPTSGSDGEGSRPLPSAR